MSRKVIFLIVLIFLSVFTSGFLKELGTLRVKVESVYGLPVASAVVSLRPLDSIHATRTKYTNYKGLVEFRFLKPGSYFVQALNEEVSAETTIDIKNGDTKNIVLKYSKHLRSGYSDFLNLMDSPVEYGGDPGTDIDDYVPSMERFQQSTKAQVLFEKNHFVVMPSRAEDLYQTYERASEEQESVFITTDIVFHTAHTLFDYTLRLIEVEYLEPLLSSFSRKMYANSLKQMETVKDIHLKAAARANSAFFGVLVKLSDESFKVHPAITSLVRGEISNIASGNIMKRRIILPFRSSEELDYLYEDYSIYKPRGHYDNNGTLRRYFKMFMWASRYGMYLQPSPRGMNNSHGRMFTLQALLMLHAMREDREAYSIWKDLNQFLVFLMGKSDDLTFDDYYKLYDTSYKERPDISAFTDESRLDEFIRLGQKLRKPVIYPRREFGRVDESTFENQALKVFGTSAVPDPEIFSALTKSPLVLSDRLQYSGNNNPFTLTENTRGVPRGLDIMAVFGSERAYEILKAEGDTEYTEYDSILEKLRSRFREKKPSYFERTLYTQYLYSIISCLARPQGQFVASFLESDAWMDKMLATSLAAWTELRHDTILYIKYYPSPTTGTIPMTYDELEYPAGYIEPYPHVYSRLSKLMVKLNTTIAAKYKQPEISGNLSEFIGILRKLREFSNRELAGDKLTKEDYAYIQEIVPRLKKLKGFSPETMKKITSGSDEKMDIVVDVFNMPYVKEVLEEAVGQSMNVFVYVNDSAGKRLCRGTVFSYYEFRWPMSDRLTDKEWQEMGEKQKRPQLPAWMSSYIVLK